MKVGNDRASTCPLTVITDAPAYARELLGQAGIGLRDLPSSPERDGDPDVPAACVPLVQTLFPTTAPVAATGGALGCWRYLAVSGFSDGSQYGRLIRVARDSSSLPDGLACVARTGRGFQGFRGRSWVPASGNLHLSLHFAPRRRIERFETIFMALAAVSVVEAIDATPGLSLRSGIRWVNDIVIDDAKVGGVLAYTQTRGEEVSSVILGIGLNVESRPHVPATAFVPRVGCLRDFSPAPSLARAGGLLRELLTALSHNYRSLLEDGWEPLMTRYRARSVVIGRQVEMSWDEPDEVPRVYARGRVASISDGMELFIEGNDSPIRRGRLILPPQEDPRNHAYAFSLGIAS